ncbi:hypothetical protein ILUMI_10104, partial [Ignelater luminosus]
NEVEKEFVLRVGWDTLCTVYRFQKLWILEAIFALNEIEKSSHLKFQVTL